MSVLLISSCIKVSAPYTKLDNQNDRLGATLESLRQWVDIAKNHKIVICDGSNYDFTNDCKNLFPNHNIECLHFQNDNLSVSKYGKGYGEGEIVKYALERSVFLKNETFFIKCGGQIWIKNFRKILDSWNQLFECDLILKRNIIRIPIIPHQVDTRFYIVNKEFYIKNFLNRYQNVRDHEGNYLEHEFFKSLKNINYKVGKYLMSQKPIINGVSGTYATRYSLNKFYWLKKQLTHFLKSFIIKSNY
jgi:hypothetical protein